MLANRYLPVQLYEGKENNMISVIIPIYRVENYLEKCIESVRNQTYRDMEIILVDDGSPDGCGAICDRYRNLDGRIKVLHKENGGLSDARNKGIDMATGEYILFVDSDDFIHPQMLEILYHAIQETGADISVCGFKEVGEKDEVIPESIAIEEELEIFENQEVMNQLQHKNLITVVAWNKLYKREIFADDIRYPKGRLHEDEFLIHQVLHRCKRTVYVERELYYYVRREDSITGKVKMANVADGWKSCEERLAFLEQHGYAQMALWTKLHMLHYVHKSYKTLCIIPESRDFRNKLRKDFLRLYKEKEVKKILGKRKRREYRRFIISSRLYPVFYKSGGRYDAK